MPFASKSQRAWMFKNHPEMATKWHRETSSSAILPQHVKKNKDTPVREHFQLAQGRFHVPEINNFKK